MRYLSLVLVCVLLTDLYGNDPTEKVVIHLIDPRIVALTDNTIRTESGSGKTDIIATRTLTQSEAHKLLQLLKVELVEDKNIPYCGHHPTYAVQLVNNGAITKSVTLCGLCGTWAWKGEMRVLHGKSSLAYLEELLPLPDVFLSIKKLPDLNQLNDHSPINELDVDKIKEQSHTAE